jgi:translation elongation factor EF-1beta
MKAKLDMKAIQAINLFEKVTRVKASYCFNYNGSLIFTVQYSEIRRIRTSQLNQMGNLLGANVKVIPNPSEKNLTSLYRFVKAIVPYPFKSINIQDKELVFLVPSTRAKAVFFGKDKSRLKELADIIKKFFDIEKVSVR